MSKRQYWMVDDCIRREERQYCMVDRISTWLDENLSFGQFITYRALKGLAPDFICTLLKMSSSRSGLRSSSTIISLSCPKTMRSWGDGAIVSAAPRLWNSLPLNLKMENSYQLFKTKLKTCLMNQTFSNVLCILYFVVADDSIIMYLLLCTTSVCALNVLSGWICAQYKCSYNNNNNNIL